MKFIDEPIALSELKDMAKKGFGNMIKAVVDIKKEVMVVDAELHSDEEAYLLENDSKQSDIWGINIYPDKKGTELIEFDSMINIRPSADNLSRGIEDKSIRERIKDIVLKLIKNDLS